MKLESKSPHRVKGQKRHDVRDRCARLTLNAETEFDQEKLAQLYQLLAVRACNGGSMGEALEDLMRGGISPQVFNCRCRQKSAKGKKRG